MIVTLDTPVGPAAYAPRLLTAADFAALPTDLPSGDVRYELNDGVVVVMPPPSYRHGRCQNKVVSALDGIAEVQLGLGVAVAEGCVVLRRDPDRVVGPDATFVLARSLPVRKSDEGFLETIPELVVEVRSKSDRAGAVRAKKEEYFAAGVLMVWGLDPDTSSVTVHRPGQPDQTFGPADTLVVDDLLPGFAVPVARLFPTD